MNQQEQNLIVKQLQQAFSVYGKPLDADAIDMWLAVLADYGAQQISYGIKQHLRDPREGRFPPKPANIIGAIEGAKRDLWLSGDEAWANAQAAADEDNTLVWTHEAMHAWFKAAQPLMELGDKIAARKAFLEAYDREIDQAIADGRPPKNFITEGHDHAGRAPAIERARDRGLISHEYADQKLIGTDREVTGDGKVLAAMTGQADPSEAKGGTANAIEWARYIQGTLKGVPSHLDEKRAERERNQAEIERRREQARRGLRGDDDAEGVPA